MEALRASFWVGLLLARCVQAAPELFESEKEQLTPADIQALPAEYSHLFRPGSPSGSKATNRSCKVYPGDTDWPSDSAWAALNQAVGGNLLKPHPRAAVCYDGPYYDAAECATISANWTNSYTHLEDPVEMFSPVYQGLTCMPPSIYDSKGCTAGGFPMYVVNATAPRHVQAAVNFARTTGVRLVVKNTGHDFSGKSGGGESLSIWTRHFKDIRYIPEYEGQASGCSGAAFKCGTGVQAFEIYKAANEKGKVVTVGVMGGYIQGGGHSPLSFIYGTGADQVLAFEVVTPDGNFVTADFTQNTDLFWALRGGGGSTLGVATSVTVKAFPDVQTTASRFSFDTSVVGNDTFWAGVRAYFDYFPTNADLGTYAYFVLLPNNPKQGVWTFQMTPFFAPNKTLAETEAILGPWLTRLGALGIQVDPNITHYDSFYPAWVESFPLEVIEKVNAASGSRLFPRANFEDPALLNTTFANIRLSSERNRVIVGFNIKATTPSPQANAVNPAWRENVLFAIQSVRWGVNATAEQIWEARRGFTLGDMQRWRDVSPGAGSYLAESDRLEPDFQQAFYGDKYPRLLELKRRFDPGDVFWAATAVGSEFWRVVTADTLPSENGRLCRVNSTGT
ncbi:hypothetical protein Daus18300_011216 [Diaporthe australafricana]|uniref:FAD-binding PCMH-type domain-containing protein n=1 Tax=Diaporthe australafricana TaxID=127596 RepID=A0ABR3W818_9PEZI